MKWFTLVALQLARIAAVETLPNDWTDALVWNIQCTTSGYKDLEPGTASPDAI